MEKKPTENSPIEKTPVLKTPMLMKPMENIPVPRVEPQLMTPIETVPAEKYAADEACACASHGCCDAATPPQKMKRSNQGQRKHDDFEKRMRLELRKRKCAAPLRGCLAGSDRLSSAFFPRQAQLEALLRGRCRCVALSGRIVGGNVQVLVAPRKARESKGRLLCSPIVLSRWSRWWRSHFRNPGSADLFRSDLIRRALALPHRRALRV